MQPIEIFRVGTHTAMAGQTLDFSRDQLEQAVQAYDPALHESPIVVGHPKDNHPAFGWIDHLELTDDGVVLAHPKQVDAEFAELVEAGRYKKRSASWYLPDSPANPKQGVLYLRHVGFLGAQPPAIKGLKDVQFADGEEGIVEFADGTVYTSSSYSWRRLANLFRRMRDKFIAQDGVDATDETIPFDDIDALIEEAERKDRHYFAAMASTATFTEGQDVSTQPTPPEQAQQPPATVDFSEREAALAKRERELAKREIGAQIDDLIAQGKVLPAQKSGLVDFMAALDEQGVVEFSEGGNKSPRTFMTEFLSSMPQVVEFGERAKEDGAATETDLSATELAAKAQAYHAKQTQAGQHISFSEAVMAVQSGKAGA